MLGSNLEEIKNDNVKVTKTIKKVLNANSENPEVVEETVFYDKEDVKNFENFENQNFGIDENANVKKNVSVEEDENGTITKVVNIEYSLLEDDVNNEGDVIIETSYLNEGGYTVDGNGEKSFVTNMDSIIIDEAEGISLIEKKENIPKTTETVTTTTTSTSQNKTEEKDANGNGSIVERVKSIFTSGEKGSDKSKGEQKSIVNSNENDEQSKKDISTTTEVVVDPVTGRKKYITKKVTRKVVTKNVSTTEGQEVVSETSRSAETPEGDISTTTEVVVDPVTGRKKYITKKITRKVVTKNISKGPKEVVSKTSKVVSKIPGVVSTKELPNGEVQTTELVIDPKTGKKKYVTKRIIRKILSTSVVESESESESEIVEQEIISEEPREQINNENSSEEVKEEIIEVPSEVPGKKKLIKRIIRYITRVNPVTGEKEVVEDIREEEPREVITETVADEEPVEEIKEEIIEVPSEVPGKKKFIKRIIRYITRINPITGEKEVVEDIREEPREEEIVSEVKEELITEQPVVEEVVSEVKEEVVPEKSVVEEVVNEVKNEFAPEKKNVIYRVFGKSNKRRNRKNKKGELVSEDSIISEDSKSEILPEVTEDIKEQSTIQEPREEVVPETVVEEQPVEEVKEEIIEVPSEVPGKKKFIKRIIRYITRINPITGEKEVVKDISEEPREEVVPETVVEEVVSEEKKENNSQPEKKENNSQSEKKSVIYRVFGKSNKRRNRKNKNGELVNEDSIISEVSEEIQEQPVVEEVSSEPREEVLPEQPSEEPITEVKEEIVEVPSEEPGKKKFIKRIIRYITKINPITGEKEIVEEQPIEEPVSEVKEEVVEVPSEEPGKKKFIKRIIRYITRVNPTTGEKEVVEEPVEEVPVEEVFSEAKEVNISEPERKNVIYRVFGKSNKRRNRKNKNGELINEDSVISEVSEEIEEQSVAEEVSSEPKEEVVLEDKPTEEPITEVKEEIVEVPSEEPGKKKFIKRIIKYITRINPVTGEKEVVEEQPVEEVVEEKPIEEVSSEPKEEVVLEDKPTEETEPVSEVKEEIVEVPSEEPGKKKFIKRIIKYITRINPVTGEKEVVEEQPVEEVVEEKPIEEVSSEPKEEVVLEEKPTEEPITEVKEEIVEVPSEEPGKKKFRKRFVKYIKRINPTTGEKEVITQQVINEKPKDEPVTEVKEEIVEVPSEESGKKKYVKRVVKYVRKINSSSSERDNEETEENIEIENPIDNDMHVTRRVVTEYITVEDEEDEEENVKDLENEEEKIVNTKENDEISYVTKAVVTELVALVESESEDEDKEETKKLSTENTIEKESIEEETIVKETNGKKKTKKSKDKLFGKFKFGFKKSKKSKKQLKDLSSNLDEIENKEEIVETTEEQGKTKYIRRIIRYRINPITGEKEVIDEPVEHDSHDMYTIREEIIEVPSDNSNRRFVKRIIKSIIRINPATGEREVIEEEPIDEPIEQFDEPICIIREEIVEAPSEEPGKKRFVKKIIRRFVRINTITGEREFVDGLQIQNPIINTREEIVEIPEEEGDDDEETGSTKYIRRIIRYRINPITGEKEMIEEPVEHVSEEMAATKEEIVELPLDESGKRRFVKRIVKYITRVNPMTGENEVVEGDSVEEPIEQFDEPICTVREEIVEVPSEEPGKKRFVKKIIRTYIKINPITGEREVIDGNQIQKSTEISDEQKNSSYVKRVIKYRINPITGQREVINESDDLMEQDIEESVITVREEIVEVPSNESGKKSFVKRIIRYITRINTITGEKEVKEEETIIEPIEQESVVVIREEIVEVPSEGSSRKSFIKKIVRYLVKINSVTGEKEIVAKQIYKEPIYNVKEETVEVPSEEGNANYSKRITRYRINPATGEREVIDEQEISNEQSEDQFEGRATEGVREEIVEIPSDEMGKSKFVKRIIKYVTRIDPVTGKKEVIEEDPIEESIDQTEEPETSEKVEVVEVPSDVPGKSILVKRTIKYIYRVNPYTGEKEVAGEQTSEEPFEDISKEFEVLNEEIIEAPYSEQSKKAFQKRTIKNIIKIHPITGDRDVVGKQQMDKPIQNLDEPVNLVKEEIVEIPSEVQGQRKFVKKIKKYSVKIDPITGEKKVIVDQSVEEPIEGFKYLSLDEINSRNVDEEFTEGKSIIGKLKNSLLVSNGETSVANYDETIDENSYSGKELIDQIKTALTFEDGESKDVSDVEIQDNKSSTENKKEVIQRNYREYEDYIDSSKKVVDESVTFKNQNDTSYNHLTDQKSIDEHDDEYIEVENHIIEQDIHPQDITTSSSEKHDLKENLASVTEDTEKTNVADESSKKQIERKKSSKKNGKKVSKKGETTSAENGECVIM